MASTNRLSPIPQPPTKLNYYQDIEVLAFPTPPSERETLASRNPKITASGEIDAAKLIDFSKTEAGQHFLESIPETSGEVQQAIQNAQRQTGMEVQARHKDELDAAVKKYREEHAPKPAPTLAAPAPGASSGSGASAAPASSSGSGTATAPASSGSGSSTKPATPQN